MTSQEQFLTTFSLLYEFCQLIITLNFLTHTVKHIQVLSDDVCRVEKCYKHKTHPSDQNVIERNNMCFCWGYSRNEKEKDDYINGCAKIKKKKKNLMRQLRQLLIKLGGLPYTLACHTASSYGVPCAVTLALVGCDRSDFQQLSLSQDKAKCKQTKATLPPRTLFLTVSRKHILYKISIFICKKNVGLFVVSSLKQSVDKEKLMDNFLM